MALITTNWAHATECHVQVEPDDTSFAGSPPHALFLGGREDGSGTVLLVIEGTADELRAFADQVTAATARLGTEAAK